MAMIAQENKEDADGKGESLTSIADVSLSLFEGDPRRELWPGTKAGQPPEELLKPDAGLKTAHGHPASSLILQITVGPAILPLSALGQEV